MQKWEVCRQHGFGSWDRAHLRIELSKWVKMTSSGLWTWAIPEHCGRVLVSFRGIMHLRCSFYAVQGSLGSFVRRSKCLKTPLWNLLFAVKLLKAFLLLALTGRGEGKGQYHHASWCSFISWKRILILIINFNQGFVPDRRSNRL